MSDHDADPAARARGAAETHVRDATVTNETAGRAQGTVPVPRDAAAAGHVIGVVIAGYDGFRGSIRVVEFYRRLGYEIEERVSFGKRPARP